MSTVEGRLTVLLAENDEHHVVLLCRALRKLGSVEQVMWVTDGEQARAYLTRDGPYSNREDFPAPDILTLNQDLPHFTGMELLRWLRRRAKFDRLPVVVFGIVRLSEEVVVNRLNAAGCATTGELQATSRAIGAAIVRAFRLASLIPDGAWYRSVGPFREPVHVRSGFVGLRS